MGAKPPSASSVAGANAAVAKQFMKPIKKEARETEALFETGKQEYRDLASQTQQNINTLLGEGTDVASQYARRMSEFGSAPSPSEQLATYQQRLQADVPILGTPAYQRVVGALDQASQQYESTVKKGMEEIPMRFAMAGKDPNANLLLDPAVRELAKGQLSIQPEFTRYNV